MPVLLELINTVLARLKMGTDKAIGRSREGLSTKIHVIVDAVGNPLAVNLKNGQVHDITQVETLVSPQAMLADKGYDVDSFFEILILRTLQPIIPPKSNRKIKRDFALYGERNLGDRFSTPSNTSGALRHVIKNRSNFLADIHLAYALTCFK